MPVTQLGPLVQNLSPAHAGQTVSDLKLPATRPPVDSPVVRQLIQYINFTILFSHSSSFLSCGFLQIKTELA